MAKNVPASRLVLRLNLVTIALVALSIPAKAACIIGLQPRVLSLVSYEYVYLAAGITNAQVLDNGCLIVADQAQLPPIALSGYPILGLPTRDDTWVWYDNGDVVPYPGYTTGAFLYTFSFNSFDGTTYAETQTITLTILGV